MRRLLLAVICAAACSQPSAPPPAAAQGETVSPKDAPVQYKVLADNVDHAKNTVEQHILVAAPPKHDEMTKLLEYLYRHLMTRDTPEPAGLEAHVYSNEAQYKTPPRSPIGSVTKKPGDLAPTFDNKIPLEFWQQVDQALPNSDKGWKLAKKIERDDNAKTVVVTMPYTEPGKDVYADQLSYNMAMNVFTDTAQAMFEHVPELNGMTFVGRWKDEDVLKITIDRATYQKLNLADIEEQIGQLHGRAFLELATGHSSDAKAAKENSQRLAGVYKKMLAGIPKGQATVSPKLK